jgi:hypothetical protein
MNACTILTTQVLFPIYENTIALNARLPVSDNGIVYISPVQRGALGKHIQLSRFLILIQIVRHFLEMLLFFIVIIIIIIIISSSSSSRRNSIKK